jgi:hypothetical protein
MNESKKDRRMRATNHQSRCRFSSSLIDDVKLIGKIWSGKFPSEEIKPRLSPFERMFMSVLIGIRIFSLSRIKELCSEEKEKKKECPSFVAELYTVGWLIALVILLLLVDPFTWSTLWIFIIVGYRIIDAVNYCLCILFVDRYERDWHPQSWNRSLILLFIIYLTLIVAFAVLYLQTQSVGACKAPLTDCWKALYFSVVTITTLGYGDYTPLNSCGEWLVVAETMFGFVLVVVIIGFFLNGLRDIKERSDTKNELKELLATELKELLATKDEPKERPATKDEPEV